MYGLTSYGLDYVVRTGDHNVPLSPIPQRVFGGFIVGGLFLSRPLAMAGLPLAVPGGFAMGALAGLLDGVIRWLSLEARAGIVGEMEGAQRERELVKEEQVRAVANDFEVAVKMAELAESLAKKNRGDTKQ